MANLMRNDWDKLNNRHSRTEERTGKWMQDDTKSPHFKPYKFTELNRPSKSYSHNNGLYNTVEVRLISMFKDEGKFLQFTYWISWQKQVTWLFPVFSSASGDQLAYHLLDGAIFLLSSSHSLPCDISQICSEKIAVFWLDYQLQLANITL